MMNKKESTKIRERDGDTAPNRNTSNGEGGNYQYNYLKYAQ